MKLRYYIFRLKQKTIGRLCKNLKDFYVENYQPCKKCGKRLSGKDGYWHWFGGYPVVNGYYHPDCGMINNPKPKPGELPF